MTKYYDNSFTAIPTINNPDPCEQSRTKIKLNKNKNIDKIHARNGKRTF